MAFLTVLSFFLLLRRPQHKAPSKERSGPFVPKGPLSDTVKFPPLPQGCKDSEFIKWIRTSPWYIFQYKSNATLRIIQSMKNVKRISSANLNIILVKVTAVTFELNLLGPRPGAPTTPLNWKYTSQHLTLFGLCTNRSWFGYCVRRHARATQDYRPCWGS